MASWLLLRSLVLISILDGHDCLPRRLAQPHPAKTANDFPQVCSTGWIYDSIQTSLKTSEELDACGSRNLGPVIPHSVLRQVNRLFHPDSHRVDIVVLGGSVARGAGLRDPNKQRYTTVLDGLVNNFTQPPIAVHNCGRSGTSSGWCEANFDQVISQCGVGRADIVLIDYGVNDHNH